MISRISGKWKRNFRLFSAWAQRTELFHENGMRWIVSRISRRPNWHRAIFWKTCRRLGVR
jgi:hypothetical protein